MLRILIIYTTMQGRTGEMVEPICDGIRDEGVEALTRSVDVATWDDMLTADGVIIGNPTRFGGMDWQLKRLFDVTAFQDYPGPLVGKVGGAFGAGGRPGGGAELALMSTLHVLLNHGMVIQGNAHGAHYGPVYGRDISAQAMQEECRSWGRLWAQLVKRLANGPGKSTRI